MQENVKKWQMLSKKALCVVLSGDYFVVKFVRTYSMYYRTPPCGRQITPCTKAKLRAKGELDLVAVAAVGRNEGRAVLRRGLRTSKKRGGGIDLTRLRQRLRRDKRGGKRIIILGGCLTRMLWLVSLMGANSRELLLNEVIFDGNYRFWIRKEGTSQVC